MLKKLISNPSLDNYLAIRSTEHVFGVKYTKEEFEKLLKILDFEDRKNGRYSTPPRSKI